MASPRTVVTTSSCCLLLIYRPRKDERLSWPSWLTYSGRFTHISGHPSAAGRAQERKVRRSKTNVLQLRHRSAVTFDTAVPPSPILAVPNVTTHLSTASVPTLLPAIRSLERRARYLFYCMFFCLFVCLLGQRFLSNPLADSRQSSHAGVVWVGT